MKKMVNWLVTLGLSLGVMGGLLTTGLPVQAAPLNQTTLTRQKKPRVAVRNSTVTSSPATVAHRQSPIQTRIFRQGAGFTMRGTRTYVHTAAFYVSRNNRLTYFSAAAMKRDDPVWYQSSSLDGLNGKQPTQSVPVTRIRVSGDITTLDYRQPIKGLPNRKLGPHHYRLVIKNLHTRGGQSFIPVDTDGYRISASWRNYAVNGRSYFVGASESTD